MKKYMNESPKFSAEIDVVETTDPAHADNINAAPKQLLQNTLVLKNELLGILGMVGSLTALDTVTKASVVAAIDEVLSIAKGRSAGYVFDSYVDMCAWIQTGDNAAKLALGDNLYIRQTNVPDYWWDGNHQQILETQKVDLTEIESDITALQAALRTAQTALQSLDASKPVKLAATLKAGAVTVSFTDPAITDDSFLDVYSSVAGVDPDMSATVFDAGTHTVTYIFDAQDQDVRIGLVVM